MSTVDFDKVIERVITRPQSKRRCRNVDTLKRYYNSEVALYNARRIGCLHATSASAAVEDLTPAQRFVKWVSEGRAIMDEKHLNVQSGSTWPLVYITTIGLDTLDLDDTSSKRYAFQIHTMFNGLNTVKFCFQQMAPEDGSSLMSILINGVGVRSGEAFRIISMLIEDGCDLLDIVEFAIWPLIEH